MKPFDLVRVVEVFKRDLESTLPVNSGFVFLGEINQMPGHGVFLALETNLVFGGFHIDNFEVIPEDER